MTVVQIRRLNDPPIMTVPRGPIVHKPSAERVMLKLDEIQHSIIQLQFRVRPLRGVGGGGTLHVHNYSIYVYLSEEV